MMIHKKLFILLTLLLMGISSNCSAKLIYDDTGRISFEASDNWKTISMGSDPYSVELHGITLDGATGIDFKRTRNKVNYESIRSLSQSEKTALRDAALNYYLKLFKDKGYTVSINKTSCLDSSINLGFTIRKNDSVYRVASMYYAKNYFCYSLRAITTDENKTELINVMKTLKIDNVPFVQWVNGRKQRK